MKDNEMYYGITIGPIVKTLCVRLQHQEDCGVASYIFSYLAKQLILEIKQNDGDVLIPSFEDKNNVSEEVGSYPDHIIFIADENLDINRIIKKIKEEAGELLYNALLE